MNNNQDQQHTPVSNAYETVRRRVIQLVLGITVPINIILLIYQLSSSDFDIATSELIVRVAYGVFGVVGLGLLIQTRFVFAITQITLLFAIIIMVIPVDPIQMLAISTFTLIISSIFAHGYLLTFAALVFLGKLIGLEGDLDAAGEPLLSGFTIVLTTLMLFAAVIILRYFSTRIRRTVAAGAARGADLIEVVTAISQVTRGTSNQEELFKQVIELIRDRLGYYHAQVFLVDENNSYANLVASTGTVGQELLRRGHQLSIGSRSVVGRVAQLGEMVVARTSERETVHSRNELLPNTRSELALPLLAGDRVVGVLDVQSTRFDVFEPPEVKTLQIIASQLSTAFQNVRLVQTQEEMAQDNQRLASEVQRSSQEIEHLSRELAGTAWRDYLKTGVPVSGVAVDAAEEVRDVDWTPQMIAASQKQAPVVEDDKLALPIMLRGQVLGAIEVDAIEDIRRDDAIDVIQSVMDRLAVRLENTRLFREAQETTAQEQRINEIVSAFQTAKSVDDLLQITLKELGQTLGAESGMIRLAGGSDEDAGEAGEHNGYQQNGDHSV